MGDLVNLVEPFDQFWKLVHPARKQGKAIARAKFKSITGNGLETRMLDRSNNEYVNVNHYATAPDLILAMKAYRMWIVKTDVEDKYILQPTNWLNRGAWEDLEEERNELADRWDYLQTRIAAANGGNN